MKCKHCNFTTENEFLFALYCHIDNQHISKLCEIAPDRMSVIRDLWETEKIICGSNGASAAANASDGNPTTEEHCHA